MEKNLTLLEKIGRDMVERMSPAQSAEAKLLWVDMSSGPITNEKMARYEKFWSKTPIIRLHGELTLLEMPPRVVVGRASIQETVPRAAAFLMFMLSRERREDVMADLSDWYPTWCVKFGMRRASFLCWWQVACCVGGAVMELVGRVGEVIGKVIAIK